MAYGIGNFLYDITVADKNVSFKFWDPEDVTNTAEVELTESDFPEGVTQPDSRQVAEVAFAQCSKVLNDKRDTYLSKEAKDATDRKIAEDAQTREAAADHFANSQDVASEPHHVDEDGTKVYNTAPAQDDGQGQSQPSDPKKSDRK